METRHTIAAGPGSVASRALAFLVLVGEITVAKPAALFGRLAWVRRSIVNPLLVLASRIIERLVACFPALQPRSAVAIIRQGTRVLFIHRADGNGFGLPGGIVFPWESHPVSLAREVEEETGLRVVSATEVCRVRGARYYEVKVCGDLRDSWEGEPTWLEGSALTRARNLWVHDEAVPYLTALPHTVAGSLRSAAGVGTEVPGCAS